MTDLIREVLTWDTPRLTAADKTALSAAEERAPEDVEVRVTRYWLPGYSGYALVADCGTYDWLSELWVRPGYRGEGRGGLLLAAVLAVRPDREVVLEARQFELRNEPGEGPTSAQLAAWYERHGFRCDGDLPPDIYMSRDAVRPR